ncbi:MAG: NfeD family protein [Clostridia bacterium]
MSLYGWLVFIVIFACFEAFTLDLIAIWFAFGALIAMITAKFTTNFTIQLTAFIIGSALMFIIFRPMLKKITLKGKDVKTNIDMIIGEIGVVFTEINTEGGEVKIAGKIWTAICEEENAVISTGQKVEILEIRGSKLVVKVK